MLEGLKDDLPGRKIMFVGDGRSDFCAARRMSDIVAAKSKLLTYMRSNGGPGAVPYDTFADVKSLMARLISDPVTVEEESTNV